MTEQSPTGPNPDQVRQNIEVFHNNVPFTVRIPVSAIDSLIPQAKDSESMSRMDVVSVPKADRIVELMITGAQIDRLARTIPIDDDGVDEDGYEVYISPQEEQRRINAAAGFITLLDAYNNAGGKPKSEHLRCFKAFLFQYACMPDGSPMTGDTNVDIAKIPTVRYPKSNLLYKRP